MTDVMIDLDTPAAVVAPGRRRRGLPGRLAVVAVLGLLAAAPATAPTTMSAAHRLPIPSYCTGAPLPGGRLNIVKDDVYVILEGSTGVIISTGPCPHVPR